MFITSAFAQEATTAVTQTPGMGGIFDFLMPFALIIPIFYFLMIRPQQKRLRDHQQMLTNLRRGDVVVTAGGLIGKIDKLVDETEVLIDLGEGTKVRAVRGLISEVRSRTEPVAANDETTTKTKKSA